MHIPKQHVTIQNLKGKKASLKVTGKHSKRLSKTTSLQRNKRVEYTVLTKKNIGQESSTINTVYCNTSDYTKVGKAMQKPKYENNSGNQACKEALWCRL